MEVDYIKVISGGITAPAGFKAVGGHCGLKKSGQKDLAIIYSEAEDTVAKGVFTKNAVPAAPVSLSRVRLRDGKLRAIVVNSGVANSCTGKKGYDNADAVTQQAARELGLKKSEITMCSTGKIGVPLPVESVARGLKYLCKKLSGDGNRSAAEAIMTTDTRVKEIAVEVTLPDGVIKIGAMAKGAGMINPDMATMLAFITTDAKVRANTLKKILSAAVNISFNKITIDGDMSTNDTVIAIANGMSETEVKPNTKSEKIFSSAVNFICLKLAEMIVKDGEGATKFVRIKVMGAKSKKDASLAARAVANSLLFKVSLFGQNSNWGRLIDALGYSGAVLVPEKISVNFGDIETVKEGLAVEGSEYLLRKYMVHREIDITIDLALGVYREEIWTCDIGRRYIDINV